MTYIVSMNTFMKIRNAMTVYSGWCRENLPDGSWELTFDDYMGDPDDLVFQHEGDYLMFKLKFGL